jgi:MFS transporter, putative metabolite:H+ symporter
MVIIYLDILSGGGREELPKGIGERIDSLNKIPLKPGILIAISLASFFTYYDVSNYAYVSPVLRNAWGISDTEVAAGASLTVLGYVIGAILITLLADAKGRRLAFIVSLLLLGIGSILASASQDITQLMIFRLITGAGIGSELAIASVYIGEMSPRLKRGKYTSILTVLGWIGLASSGPISLALVQDEFMGLEGWRIVFGIAGVVALISLPFRWQMPESPRWLLSKGRVEETNKFLESIGLGSMQSTTTDGKNRDFSYLKDRTTLMRMLSLVLVWFLVYIPIYSAFLLVVEYVNQGYTVTESISINLLASIGFAAGGVMAVIAGDRMERKYQIAIASIIMSMGFILRGLLVQDFNGSVIAGFIAFFANAWVITALLIYTAENFRTKIRSSAAGIVEGSARGLAAVAPFVFVLLQPFGFLNIMLGLATFSFIGTIAIVVLGKRTRGQSLEKLTER